MYNTPILNSTVLYNCVLKLYYVNCVARPSLRRRFNFGLDFFAFQKLNNKRRLIDRTCSALPWLCACVCVLIIVCLFTIFFFSLKGLESVAPILKSSRPATCVNQIFSILSSLCTTAPDSLSRLNVLLSSDLSKKIR